YNMQADSQNMSQGESSQVNANHSGSCDSQGLTSQGYAQILQMLKNAQTTSIANTT
ncbi:hypothetical protein HAX54_031175, partial [Datura stramonium]|nr:hypothetical protein [Datura stramonium]